MAHLIEKVTGFITRPLAAGDALLLFEHPYAGIQIPAGTVEEGETPEEAILREVAEETGLTAVRLQCCLGTAEVELPPGQRIIARPTRVYARPDPASFDWAHLRRGIPVAVHRREAGFSQVAYEEPDRVPAPNYVSMSILGWVPDDALAGTRRRHFFHLVYLGPSEERWTVFTDSHAFTLFWAPLAALPEIVAPQDEWLAYLFSELRGGSSVGRP
jgi:8-oxo-dGTP pyrophosphatase MutT (NUDIX family)